MSPEPAVDRPARHRWQQASRVLSAALLVLILGAIGWYARSIEWQPVLDALRSYRPATLATAAGVATLSCLLYAGFDLLTRPHAHAAMSWRWIVPVAFTSYTFTLNLGPWIGSLGMRLREYTKLGLGSAQVLRILVFTTLTNWSGYVLLGGLVFAAHPPAFLPESAPIGTGALRAAGLGLLAVTAMYWALCAFARRRVYTIRGLSIRLPSARMAMLQAALGSANWLLIALVPWVLLKTWVPFEAMLATTLLASIAGAIMHIPGGVGVIEAVVLTLLGDQVPHGQLVAALLVYRAAYYLWPFMLGLATFAVLESLIRRRQP